MARRKTLKRANRSATRIQRCTKRKCQQKLWFYSGRWPRRTIFWSSQSQMGFGVSEGIFLQHNRKEARKGEVYGVYILKISFETACTSLHSNRRQEKTGQPSSSPEERPLCVYETQKNRLLCIFGKIETSRFWKEKKANGNIAGNSKVPIAKCQKNQYHAYESPSHEFLMKIHV